MEKQINYTDRFEKMMYGIDNRMVFDVDGVLYSFHSHAGFYKGYYRSYVLDVNKQTFYVGTYSDIIPDMYPITMLLNDFELLPYTKE